MSSQFETQVLAEFSNVSTAIRETSTGVHKRIDKLQSDLSSRIVGLELRLERNTAATKNNTDGINDLKSEFGKHKDEDTQRIELGKETKGEDPPPRRGPFSITVDDLQSLLKLLPFIVALGAGIAGGVMQLTDDDVPGKSDATPSRPEPVQVQPRRTLEQFPAETSTNPDEQCRERRSPN